MVVLCLLCWIAGAQATLLCMPTPCKGRLKLDGTPVSRLSCAPPPCLQISIAVFSQPWPTPAFLQVPTSLQDAVKQSLEAVSAPEAQAGALSTADARAVWGCLADCMRDGSELGSRVGRGWLLQLLVVAAEQELSRSSSDGGGEKAGNPQQQQQQQQDEGGEEALAPSAGAPPLPALLPEVTVHGGCQLEEGRRGMQGQDGLRELLMRALATTPDSRAADCFISAVGSLLAYVRLRCAAVGWDQADGWAGNGSGSFATAATPGPDVSGGSTSDFRTPLSASASGSALRAAGSAARLSALQSPSSHSRQPSKQQLAAQASVDSLPDAETSAVRIVPSDSIGSLAQSSPSDGQGGMWRVSARLLLSAPCCFSLAERVMVLQ